jgi:hypothetical protein
LEGGPSCADDAHSVVVARAISCSQPSMISSAEGAGAFGSRTESGQPIRYCRRATTKFVLSASIFMGIVLSAAV